jgi:hypothetical protein
VEMVLRKALKISDPANVEELSRALLVRYGKDAVLIDRERKGLPFSVVLDRAATSAMVAGKRPEIADAQNDLERVLAEIAKDPTLAEIASEMRGWARAIRAAAADGLSAARFALDPQSSDQAMTARRTLGDYARVSRYAAALASCGSGAFCRLAQACDALGSLILVLLGDGLAEAGVTRSTHIPRVPVSTLRQRRDMVINELNLLNRNASGLGSPDLWPRGTVSLLQVNDQLGTSDAADLRSLLDERYLSRQLDDLLDLAADTTPDGLKALGSVASMSVRRFRRFISAVSGLGTLPSPPLSRFLAALGLFVQGFADSAGGYRLPFLARSPLLVGQASLVGGSDVPTMTLIQIALARSAAAEWIDCLCCSCDDKDAEKIILFAKMVYDLDRAIDLYAFGTDVSGLGDSEIRADAYSAVVQEIITSVQSTTPLDKFGVAAKAVKDIATLFLDPGKFSTAPAPASQLLMREVLTNQLKEEKSSARLVSAISPICRNDIILRVLRNQGIWQIIQDAWSKISPTPGTAPIISDGTTIFIPPDIESATAANFKSGDFSVIIDQME